MQHDLRGVVPWLKLFDVVDIDKLVHELWSKADRHGLLHEGVCEEELHYFFLLGESLVIQLLLEIRRQLTVIFALLESFLSRKPNSVLNRLDSGVVILLSYLCAPIIPVKVEDKALNFVPLLLYMVLHGLSVL